MTRPVRRPVLATTLLCVAVLAMAAVTPIGAASRAATDATSAAAHTTASAPAARPGGRARPATRPNIVLITSDDQTDMEMRWMPRTRRLLGRSGVTFRDAISPHPLCCPARAELLTGEYAQNNGVRHNSGPLGGYGAFMEQNGDDNLAVWLRRAGYRTGFVGKTMNGYPGTRRQMDGWDHWNAITRRTYAYYGSTFQKGRRSTTYRNTYVADVITDETTSLVRRWSRDSRPFFIYASHVGPHTATGVRGGARFAPPIPARRHRDLFSGVRLPTRGKASFGVVGVGKPRAVRATKEVRNGAEWFRQRIRSLQAIDEGNAAIIRALRRSGELENTLVIYTSDNGFQLGEHGLFSKNWAYQENLQVPLLARGPGLPRGRVSPETASIVDIAPTILGAAGALGAVRRAGRTDGEDLLPVARGRRQLNDTSLIQAGTATPRELAALGWRFRGVRTPRYTWVVWWDGFEELYDRALDPFETVNIAGPGGLLLTPLYLGVRAELRGRYEALRDCSGVRQCERQDFGPEPSPLLG